MLIKGSKDEKFLGYYFFLLLLLLPSSRDTSISIKDTIGRVLSGIFSRKQRGVGNFDLNSSCQHVTKVDHPRHQLPPT
jgi:hypothetical protein